jgi:hypothetical protein
VKGSEFYKEQNENANINAIAKSGFYYYGDNSTPNRQGAPNNYGGVIEHKEIGNGYAFQKANTLDKSYFERTKLNGTWSDWKQLATTETATLALLNGWANLAGFETIKAVKVGNKVSLSGVIASGASIVVCALPTGFKPSATVIAMAISNNNLLRVDIYVD